ncbi:MAG: hypothetical protein ABSB59_32040 [Streptosporangiaceae bacterium]
MGRRLLVLSSFALLFGVGDGGGYLLGTALHYSVPDGVSTAVEYGFLLILGAYWIAIALLSRKAAQAELEPRSRWGVWVLPWALSVDNLTYGAVDGIPAHYSVWASAGEQALSSAVQAGVGLAIGIGLVAAFPALRRRMAMSSAIAGVMIIVAARAARTTRPRLCRRRTAGPDRTARTPRPRPADGRAAGWWPPR